MMENTHLKILTILIIFNILCGFIGFGHSHEENKNINNYQISSSQNKTDINNWNLNTNWTYEQKIWINYTAGNYVRLNETITYEVSDIGDHTYNGSTYYSYNLTLNGRIIDGYGMMDGYNIQINGGSINGYMLCKVSDQGKIVDYQHRDMYGQAEVYNGVWMDFDATVNSSRYYHKVSETYDFPIKTNETFWGNTSLETFGDYYYSTAGGTYSGSDTMHSYSKVNQTNRISRKLQHIEVPFGNYTSFKVDKKIEYNSTNDNNHIRNLYNESIGSYVKQTADLTTSNSSLYWVRKLTGYNENNTYNSTCNINPKVQRISNKTLVTGNFSKFKNTNITLYIPSSKGKKIWTTKTNSDGYYNMSIKVPLAPDNTPTTMDFSSAGIIVKVNNNPNVFDVSTLTTLPDNIKPKITDLTGTNATTGDNFTFEARVTDNVDLVKSVEVMYWYDSNNLKTIEMNRSILSNKWRKKIKLSTDYSRLKYQFTAVDIFNNVNKSEIYLQKITDNDPPELTDKTSDHAIPGTNFKFKAAASDNIKLNKVCVKYTTDKSNFKNLTMDKIDDCEYEKVEYIRKNSKSITYKLSAKDMNGNWVSLDNKEIPVKDTKSPTANAGRDMTINATEMLRLSGKNSSDNVGIVNYTWDVDGELKYSENISITFYDLGYHQAELTVKDAVGNSDIDTVNITVVDKIMPSASAGEDKTVIEDTKVHFNGTSSDDNAEIVSYTWKIEDKVLNGKNVDYTFSSPGIYKVILQVSDIGGNRDEDVVNITVEDVTEPVIRIDYDEQVDEDTLVVLDASMSYDNYKIDTIMWVIKGEQRYGAIINYTFKEPGKKEIGINITDKGGNYKTSTFDIEVEDTTDPKAVCKNHIKADIGEDITLNASESHDNYDISKYKWDIGDETFYGEVFKYSFEKSGEFWIELNVFDYNENKDKCSIKVEVKDMTPPEIVIDNNMSVSINKNVTFKAEDVEDNGEISKYIWEIESELHEERNINYSFDKIGDYNVNLTVIDAGGNSAYELIDVDVKDFEKPESNVKIFENNRREFMFDASNSSDNGNIVNYHWEFGDGTTDEGKKVSHKYSEPGEYKITLIIEDGAGNSDKITKTVKVEKKNDEIPGFGIVLLFIGISIVSLFIKNYH